MMDTTMTTSVRSRPPGRLLIFLLLPTLLQPITASLTIVQIEPFDPSLRSHHLLYSFESSSSSSNHPSGGSKSSHGAGHRHLHNHTHKEGDHHHGRTRTGRFTTVRAAPSPITSTESSQSIDPKSGDSWTQSALALLLLPFLCATGLVGNAFVCVAIATDRRLQNVTNYFLFSLALADLLVCCVVMPLSILVEIKKGQWEWSFYLCLLYVYADVFLCSASIVHMSVISLDRYLGISQPLKTRNRTKTAIFIKIILVWVITIIISCPIVVLGLQNDKHVLNDQKICAVHNQNYMIYGSTFAFLIPFIIMTVTYFKTTSLLNKQAMLLQQGNGKGTKNGLRRAAPPRKLGYSLRRSSGGASTPTISAVNHSKWSSSTTTGISLHNINGAAQTPVRSKRSLPQSMWQKSVANGGGIPANDTLSDDVDVRPRRQKPSRLTRWTNRTSSYLSLIVSRVQKKGSYATNMELLSEHKATRVLAVVFICFFFCWTPFFIANFFNGFCGTTCAVPMWASTLFLWLGYVSSTINPLIYTVFNKRFRKAFIRILRGRCFRKRSADNTYVGPNSHWSRTHTIMPDNCTYSAYDQRPYRADESMIRPTGAGGNHHTALGHRDSNGTSPLITGTASTNGATPRKKDSGANGRSVAFDNRQWSPSSSSTSTALRKESAAGAQSRTPSLRKTSRLTQSTTRTNTEEEVEEEAEAARGDDVATDRAAEKIPLVDKGGRRRNGKYSSTEEEVDEEEEIVVADDDLDCAPSTSSDGPPIPSGCVRVTLSEVDLPRKRQSFILLSSPSIKRSQTNSALLESPTRLVPTASDCLVAHPLVIRGGARNASLLASSPSPSHIARGVLCSSENNLAMGSGRSDRGTSCTVFTNDDSDDDDSSDASTASSTQTSIGGGCITPPRSETNPLTSSTSSSSSSKDNGPALTLVGSNGHGKVFKETFL